MSLKPLCNLEPKLGYGHLLIVTAPKNEVMNVAWMQNDILLPKIIQLHSCQLYFDQAYQKWGTGPGHGGQSSQVSHFAQHIELLLSDGENFVFKRVFPGIQLQHFDAIEDLVHQLDARVFVLHLFHLGDRRMINCSFRDQKKDKQKKPPKELIQEVNLIKPI